MKCLIRATGSVALAVLSALGSSACASSAAPARTAHDDAASTETTSAKETTTTFSGQTVDTSTSLTGATVGPSRGPGTIDEGSPPAVDESRARMTTGGALAHDTTPRLTDAQILEAVAVAQAAEEEETKLAKARAKSARVAHFASDLIMDGRALGAQRAALAQKVDRSSGATSAHSSEIDVERGGYVQALRTSDGSAFDRRFVAAQVKQNQSMLKLLDEHLIPSAKNSDVRDYLHSLRARTIAHLLAAQEIDNQLP